jgi:hypothetical protein
VGIWQLIRAFTLATEMRTLIARMGHRRQRGLA